MSDQHYRVVRSSFGGCVEGSVVRLDRKGDELRVLQPDGVVLSKLDARRWRQSTPDGGFNLLLRNPDDGAEISLAGIEPPRTIDGHVFQPRSAYPDAEHELYLTTSHWTLPVFTNTYRNNDEGRRRYSADAEVLGLYGYGPATQSEEGGHVHVGRILMTSGLSVLAGKRGIRSDGSITVTFQKSPMAQSSSAPPEPSGSGSVDGLEVAGLIEKLGQLHAAGILTDAEFEKKKAELLDRL